MNPSSTRWHVISKSNFAWEQQAFDYLRKIIPDDEEWHVWTNFEFISSDGAIYEVDALVLSPYGLWLMEIKSHPGKLNCEEGLWVFEHEGRRRAIDNPVIVTNRKAKCLKGLILSNLSGRRIRMPWVNPLIFCAGHPVRYRLKSHEEAYVTLREDNAAVSSGKATGVIQAMETGNVPGVNRSAGQRVGPQERGAVLRAINDMLSKNILRSASSLQKVGDYKLKKLLDEGAGYQDWVAEHQSLKTQRRIRLYLVHEQATKEDRARIQRAAEREAKILQNINDPGILTFRDFVTSEQGPALIFDHYPDAVRLDQYLANQNNNLDIYTAYEIMEKLVDAVRQAHAHHLIHRALSPRSILCIPDKNNPEAVPQIALMNWQTASSQATTKVTLGTIHVGDLVENLDAVYLAPESLMNPEETKNTADVFSLGCIAYRLFAGHPPAQNQMELNRILQENNSLSLSSVADGVPGELHDLIDCATQANPEYRTASVRNFKEDLEEVMGALVSDISDNLAEDPLKAQKGEQIQADKTKELYTVEARIGSGSSAIALQVKDSADKVFVLKIARDHTKSETLESEFSHLEKLRDRCIVRVHKLLTLSGNTAILMDDAGQSLASYIRELGRLQYDMLQRMGEDLIRTVHYLEEQGIFHRDIKPDNIGVTQARSGTKHQVPILFDFSLSGVSADKLGVGTRQYMDPFLANRRISRYDTHAERFTLAVTLYEMATAKLPSWEGGADPSVETDAELVLASESFPPNIRDELKSFFEQALNRDITKRFDNAHEMMKKWVSIFNDAETKDEKATLVLDEDEVELSTEVACLGLSPRATNVLDRMNILSLEQLLQLRLNDLRGRKGISVVTKKEIVNAKKKWIERFPNIEEVDFPAEEYTPTQLTEQFDGRLDEFGLEFCLDKIKEGINEGTKAYNYMTSMLGLNPDIPASNGEWHTQSQIANHFKIKQPSINVAYGKCKGKWKQSRTIQTLRDNIFELLEAQGGVMTSREISLALLAQRGCLAKKEQRNIIANAIVRAAVEVEEMMKSEEVRFSAYRYGTRIIISTEQSLAQYAKELGDRADQLCKDYGLLGPSKALESLKQIHAPKIYDDRRALSLAAQSSFQTALSTGRMELYSKDMPADQALLLASGSFAGLKELTIELLIDRVKERYPEASALPDRPVLDEYIESLNLGYKWNSSSMAYLRQDSIAFTSRPTGMSLFANTTSSNYIKEPNQIDAESCQRQLEGSAHNGSFLALQVRYELESLAEQALANSFSQFQILDIEKLMIDLLHQEARDKRVDWNVVLKADIQPKESRDFNNLKMLVRMILPKVKERVTNNPNPLILTRPGLLARYEAMSLFDYWRDISGSSNGPSGIWVLISSNSVNSLPTIDGEALPILGANQSLTLNQHWIYTANKLSRPVGKSEVSL